MYVFIKKIGLYVFIILFRKNWIVYNFYIFVLEIKYEMFKVIEVEIKVIFIIIGIFKLSKIL